MDSPQPRYPIYIISKGRAESRLTSKALEEIAVPYRIVVEPQEYEDYAAVIQPSKILTLPFSNLGLGSIPARNWVWQHSLREGAERHWILDDNIRAFNRLNANLKVTVSSGATFAAAEDFTDRYLNAPMAGMNYRYLVKSRAAVPPFTLTTRIYSCILLSNRLSHRWRGRYNEDTDLSLRILKDGFCTILFNTFVCDKQTTMTMRGGNTEELYRQDSEFDGRLAMARSLQAQHPDVVSVKWKFHRWQHSVDYRPFRNNKLQRRPGVEVLSGVNNYGMQLHAR